jgi:putative transposase
MTSRGERLNMIESNYLKLSIVEQCDLLTIQRSSLYYSALPESEMNLNIMSILDKQYFMNPFYGVIRLTAMLNTEGFLVNGKQVRHLMKLMHWRTIFLEPCTTISKKTDSKYPYLFRGLKIEKLNQVWAMDITYIPMRHGFMYLAAIINLHSRYVVGWSVSNSMTAEWCTEVLQAAIQKHGKPGIFNTDQGNKFTSEVFIEASKFNEIRISMDGNGRAVEYIFIEQIWKSVKYENIYLNVYENGMELYKGLNEYFEFYNNVRLHQSLNYESPSKIYHIAA